MSDAKLLIKEIKTLPANRVAEVLDFVKLIKQKEGCPICAKYCDPETGELCFNAETIAAFEEGDAMLCGEISAKWFNSPEEMWEDLMNEELDD